MTIFIQNIDFSKTQEKPKEKHDFGLPDQLQIAQRWPQARSRWPKIDPIRLQDGFEECFCRCLKSSSIWRSLEVVLGSILVPFGLPKCETNITLPPSSIMLFMVFIWDLILVLSLIIPFFEMGTLKSTLIRAVLFLKDISWINFTL